MPSSGTTLAIGGGLLAVCLVCLTVLAAKGIVPSTSVTNLASTIAGGILAFLVPGGMSRVFTTTTPPVRATETIKSVEAVK